MKFTLEQITQIIKEEIAAVLNEDAEDSASDLFDAVEAWQNAKYPEESWEGISDLFDTLKDELEFAGDQDAAGDLDEYYDNMVGLIFENPGQEKGYGVKDADLLEVQVGKLNNLLNDLM